MATNSCHILLSENNSDLWCITLLTVNIYCSYAFHYIKFCIYYEFFVLKDEVKTYQRRYNCKTWVYILLVSYACSMPECTTVLEEPAASTSGDVLKMHAAIPLTPHNGTFLPYSMESWESQTYGVVGYPGLHS